MKKTLFIFFTLVMYCKSVDATEIRRFVAEPYHAQVYFDTIFSPDNSLVTAYFCGPVCFKFYDTLVGYTNCPCPPDDTVKDVLWLTSNITPNLNMTVKKGTVFYQCWEATQSFSCLPTAINGIGYGFKYSHFLVEDCQSKAKFEIKELESSCSYKKVQILDSNEHINMHGSVAKWYLIVKDSLENIVQIDSGYEVSPYTVDSNLNIIENQRPSPIIELRTTGLYSISFVIAKSPGNLDSYYNDTSTQYVRVEDCLTGIKDDGVSKSNIQLQMLSNNQLHIQNVNEKKLSLNIYSIDGRNLFNALINTTNASLDMNRYNKGMYIVSILENDALIFSGKIILK